MNRIEFMKTLERLLNGIAHEDKVDALQYYNDYFDEAGSENEAAVIQELESPEKVASIIKESLGDESKSSGEYSERGYQDERFEKKEELLDKREKKSKIPLILIILGIIFIGLPVVLPLGVSGVGVVFAIAVTIVALVFSVFITGVSLVVAGVAVVIYAIMNIISSTAHALVAAGTGLILIAFGTVVSYLGILVAKWFIKLIGKGIVVIREKATAKKVV